MILCGYEEKENLNELITEFYVLVPQQNRNFYSEVPHCVTPMS